MLPISFLFVVNKIFDIHVIYLSTFGHLGVNTYNKFVLVNRLRKNAKNEKIGKENRVKIQHLQEGHKKRLPS